MRIAQGKDDQATIGAGECCAGPPGGSGSHVRSSCRPGRRLPSRMRRAGAPPESPVAACHGGTCSARRRAWPALRATAAASMMKTSARGQADDVSAEGKEGEIPGCASKLGQVRRMMGRSPSRRSAHVEEAVPRDAQGEPGQASKALGLQHRLICWLSNNLSRSTKSGPADGQGLSQTGGCSTALRARRHREQYSGCSQQSPFGRFDPPDDRPAATKDNRMESASAASTNPPRHG